MQTLTLSGRHGTFDILIDDEDMQRVQQYSWYVAKDGYVRTIIALGGKRRHGLFLHRWLLNAPTGAYVDHINHNRQDNRKDNLRLCSKRMNCANKIKTDDTDGVSWDKQSKRWRVCVGNGATGYRGRFKDQNAAFNCYNHWATEVYGEFASLNKCVPMTREEWEAARCRPPVGKSRYTHVYYDEKRGLWVSKIHSKSLGIVKHIGRFPTEDEASMAYNAYIDEHGLNVSRSLLKISSP